MNYDTLNYIIVMKNKFKKFIMLFIVYKVNKIDSTIKKQ